MAKYYICGGSDQYWIATTAKTLAGAKTAAGKAYQYAVGGKVEIAEKVVYADGDGQYVRVAVKYGFEKWQQA